MQKFYTAAGSDGSDKYHLCKCDVEEDDDDHKDDQDHDDCNVTVDGDGVNEKALKILK